MGGGGKKLAAWLGEGDWNVHSLFRKKGLGWRKWSPDGGRRSYCTHIYRSKKHMHPPPPPSLNLLLHALHLQQRFPPGYTPLGTVFLTLLSHFLYPVFLRWPFFFFFSSTVSFTVPPELNGEPSRNNKY